MTKSRNVPLSDNEWRLISERTGNPTMFLANAVEEFLRLPCNQSDVRATTCKDFQHSPHFDRMEHEITLSDATSGMLLTLVTSGKASDIVTAARAAIMTKLGIPA